MPIFVAAKRIGAAIFFGATATTGGDNTIRITPTDPTSLAITQVSGFYMITIDGTVGASYRLETCSDMDTGPWEPLAIITLTRRPWSYVDGESEGQTTRFYRTVRVD